MVSSWASADDTHRCRLIRVDRTQYGSAAAIHVFRVFPRKTIDSSWGGSDTISGETVGGTLFSLFRRPLGVEAMRVAIRSARARSRIVCLVGVLLSVAGVLKWGAAPPAWLGCSAGFLSEQWGLVAATEVLLGLLLISFPGAKSAWWTASGFFLLGGILTSAVAWRGVGECGCLGRVGISPLVMAAVDWSILGVLLISRPSSWWSLERRGAVLIAMSLCTVLLIRLSHIFRETRKEPGDESTSSHMYWRTDILCRCRTAVVVFSGTRRGGAAKATSNSLPHQLRY